MKVNIIEIEEEGIDIDFSETLHEPGVIDSVGEVVAHLHLDRQMDEIFISGDIKGNLRLQCSRCLTSFQRHIELDINLTYLPIEEINKMETYEIKDDESNISYYRGEQLDITEIVQEQLILSIPMKPLCEENCKGLCPVCGANLNIQECGCEREKVDPRLSILKKLFERKE
jgi:uncharacterized protein